MISIALALVLALLAAVAGAAAVLIYGLLRNRPSRTVASVLGLLQDGLPLRDALSQVLPLLQPAAFDRPTRRAIGEQNWELEDLRKACAEAAGVEIPKLARLRRVSVQSIICTPLTHVEMWGPIAMTVIVNGSSSRLTSRVASCRSSIAPVLYAHGLFGSPSRQPLKQFEPARSTC